MKLSLAVLLFVILLFGCIQSPDKIMSSLNENELALYLKKGTASIVGQAYRKTKGREVKYGAGVFIYLMPVCSYTSEFIKGVSTGQRDETIDHRLNAYIRKTVGDAEGRFEFLNLPAGSYYVFTVINWEGGAGYKGSLERTSGVIYRPVSVSEGEKVKVIVTN